MSTKPLYMAHDNLDDRREVHRLLTRLPPILRLRWLKWCCARCTLPNSNKHPVIGLGTTGANGMEIFYDFWQLANQYNLDPRVGMDALVQVLHHDERGDFKRGSLVRVHLPR